MTLDIKSLLIGSVVGVVGVYAQPFINANSDLVAYGLFGLFVFALGLVGYCVFTLNRAFSPKAIRRDLEKSLSESKQNTAQEGN